MPNYFTFQNRRTLTFFTSDVLGAQVRSGRTTYLENYNGGGITITIRNNTNQSSGFQLGDEIRVENTSTGTGVYWKFSVYDITYDNEYGNFAAATATLTCLDETGRLGRAQVTAAALTQSSTSNQTAEVCAAAGFAGGGVSGLSTASSSTYTGSVLARINQLNATEGCVMFVDSIGTTIVVGRGYVGSSDFDTGVTLGRDWATYTVGLDSLERIQYGTNYANEITVNPSGLASQRAANVTALPQVADSVTTLDATTTQALGLATWVRAVRSDQTNQAFIARFTYAGQTAAQSVIYTILQSAFAKGLISRFTLTYRVPGAGSDTSTKVFCEGFDVAITPDKAVWTLYLSPDTFYQFFTLNSSTLGVLNTSRLGW